MAGRTDEFAGRPVDPHIDVGKLRRWLEDRAQRAQEMQMAAETDEAGKRATWEWGYYVLLRQMLDAGKDPLAPFSRD